MSNSAFPVLVIKMRFNQQDLVLFSARLTTTVAVNFLVLGLIIGGETFAQRPGLKIHDT